MAYLDELTADGAVGFWKLNEASGDYADTIAGGIGTLPAYSAVLRSQPEVRYTNGASVKGGATASVTNTAVARLSGVPAALASSTVTVECWVRIPAGTHRGAFFGIGDANGWTVGIGNSSDINNYGRRLVLLANNISWQVTSYDFPTTDGVFHVATVRNGSTFITYVNGVQVDSRTFSPSAPASWFTLGGLMEVGVMIRGLSDTVSIDSVSVVPSALSAARVLAHFNAGVSLLGQQVTGLQATALNASAQVRWEAKTGAADYEWRVNGGAATATAGATSVTVTSLTNGVSSLIEVRPKNSTETGDWASVSVTPRSTIFFYDNFDRANSAASLGSPVSGGPYSVVAGTWGVSGNAAYTSASTGGARVTFPGSYDFDAVWQVPVQSGAQSVGFIFRYTDANNYWLAYINNGTLRIHRITAGVGVDIFNLGAVLTTDTFRIVGKGRMLYFFINSVNLFETEDPHSPTASLMGYYVNSTTAARIDNVAVDSAPPADMTGGVSGGTSVLSDETLAAGDPAGDSALADLTLASDLAASAVAAAWLYKGRDLRSDDLVNIP